MPHPTVMGTAVRAMAACLTALCAFAHVTAAQTAPRFLTRGAQVRVVGLAARPIEGTLVQLANDTVVIARGDQTSTVALDNNRRLEVFARTGNRAGQGTLIGVGFGLATGFVIGWATWDLGVRATGTGDPGENVFLAALVGGVCGALTGRLIGAAIGRNAWTRVETAGVRVAVMPQALGIGVALSF